MTPPEPEALGAAIGRLHADRARAAAQGDAGYERARDDHVGRRHREAGRMTKLIIQIPCLNEAATLPATLADLPRQIPGIDVIEILVIDDGSRDDTVEVARAHGVHHVVRFRRRKGLAAAFAAGIDAALKLGADYHRQHRCRQSVRGRGHPAAARAAALAATRRSSSAIATSATSQHMSWPKKLLQRLGSWTVRQVSSTQVPDTTSGFRAYTREAALRMTIVSEFSYTLESIIQAGKKRMAIAHVEVAQQSRHAALATVRQHLRLHQALGGDDRAHLRDVRAAQGLHLPRLGDLSRRFRDFGALPVLLCVHARTPKARFSP